jgi:hypothetical protein
MSNPNPLPRWGSNPAEALSNFIFPPGEVCVAIPDATRPLDPRPARAALEAALAVRPGNFGHRTVVGLGLHRGLLAEERVRLGGGELIEHDPDDAHYLGEIDGLPAWIGRPVAEADYSIGVGVAELHQYAGLSGGHKAVAVGCGGRATIAGLHRRDRVMAPGVALGRLKGNPFRSFIDQLGERARCRYCLLQVGSRWVFGEPRSTLQAALTALDPWEPVDGLWPGAILTVPASKALSLYQASRAATYLGLSPNPPLEPGATLFIEAELPEGAGSESGFVAALARNDLESLLEGPEPTGAGAQRAVMLAILARKYHMVLCGVADPGPLRALGIDARREGIPDGPYLRVPDPFHRLPQRKLVGTF